MSKQPQESFAACACSGKNLPKLVCPMILALLKHQPAHGYGIARQIAETFSGSFAPNSSSIYRILNSLEEDGYVTVHLEEAAAGPVRKVYQITDSGQECLREWTRSLAEFRGAVEKFLQIAE